jgi:hypothetical protein
MFVDFDAIISATTDDNGTTIVADGNGTITDIEGQKPKKQRKERRWNTLNTKTNTTLRVSLAK